MRTLLALTLVFYVTVVTPAQATDLVKNGSFEETIVNGKDTFAGHVDG
jgi:hypothetical protein